MLNPKRCSYRGLNEIYSFNNIGSKDLINLLPGNSFRSLHSYILGLILNQYSQTYLTNFKPFNFLTLLPLMITIMIIDIQHGSQAFWLSLRPKIK